MSAQVRTGLTLGTLFLATFAMGSAELVVVGVLDAIADDAEVRVSTAGLLVTAYALGIAVGGPLLTAATMRYGRRPVLLAALATYVAGNLLLVLATTFGLMLAARLVTGALQGLFIGVAFAIGTSVVPPARMGYAISVVLGGVSVSTALGVPIGTFVGHQFGWRTAFAGIVFLSVVALVSALRWIPAVTNAGTGNSRAQARHALAPRVLAVLGAGFLVLGGQFAALTYLASYLQDVTGISADSVSGFLLVYGIANAVGTFIGGRAADKNPVRTLAAAAPTLVAAICVLYFWGDRPIAVLLALAVWGVVGFGLVPSLQYRVVQLAGPGRDLAATLPASALTAGIAAGSAIGGWALVNHGQQGAVASAVVLCAAACPAIWATSRLRYVPRSADSHPAETTAGARAD